MRTQRSSLRIATMAAAFTLVASGCSGTQSPVSEVPAAPAGVDLPEVFTPVLVNTVGVETAPVETRDGTWRVLYELVLTNAKAAPATIERISVVDASQPDTTLATLEGEELAAAMHPLSGGQVQNTALSPDKTVMAFMELSFDSLDDVPGVVAHRIEGAGASNPAATVATAMDYVTAPFTLRDKTEVVMSPPVHGDHWFAVNGIGRSSDVHRGAVQSIGGQLYDAQRFAIDWMRLSDDNTLASGDVSKVENWHSYDEPVFAVADAEVVEVLDGLPDQAPGTLPDPASITLQTVDGNHVILKLADGVYAFYAHLKEGSISVKEGDKVDAGDEIGRLGNSGNTSAPHLHLHLMTAGSALAADSIPYTFDDFSYEGQISDRAWSLSADLEGPWTVEDPAGTAGTAYSERLPLGLDVVKFGD